MEGETILAQTLSVAGTTDPYGNNWQYHPNSDRHSKAICWGILFDLLITCDLLRAHAAGLRIAFGVNHSMLNPQNGETKALDLVVCRPHDQGQHGNPNRTFAGMVQQFGLQLSAHQAQLLNRLPVIYEKQPVQVLIALEAKAAMTRHRSNRKRLRGEFSDSLGAIQGNSIGAVAAAHGLVNYAPAFVSPLKNKVPLNPPPAGHPVVSNHTLAQAHAARLNIEGHAIRAGTNAPGWDAVGVTPINLVNDGTPVNQPAPLVAQVRADRTYDAMINKICQEYSARFPVI